MKTKHNQRLFANICFGPKQDLEELPNKFTTCKPFARTLLCLLHWRPAFQPRRHWRVVILGGSALQRAMKTKHNQRLFANICFGPKQDLEELSNKFTTRKPLARTLLCLLHWTGFSAPRASCDDPGQIGICESNEDQAQPKIVCKHLFGTQTRP